MPPVNDNLANATVISGSSASLGGTLVDSTLESGPWTLEGGYTELTYWGVSTVNDGRSAIYKRSPTEDESIVLGISGSGFNPYVEVYRDLGPGNDMEFVGWFGDGTATPLDSTPFSLSSGETYYIFVWNWEFDTSEGTFTLSSNAVVPPANDAIANAIQITLDQLVSGTTSLATQSADEAAKGLDITVWYKLLIPSTDMTIQLDIINSDEFQTFRGWVSNALGDATTAADLAASPFLFHNMVPPGGTGTSFTNQTGWVYFSIGSSGDTGDFSFQLSYEAEEDNHNFGIFLPSQPVGWMAGNNVGATTEVGEPAHAGVGTHHSVWYDFSPISIGEYTFTVERLWGDLVDPAIAIYKDAFNNFGSMTLVASNADSPFPSVTFTVDEADRDGDYALVVAGRAEGQEGGYIINWHMNDVLQSGYIADAVVISGTDSVSNVHTDGSMMEFGNVELDGFSNALGNHWYKFVAPADGSIVITGTFDSFFAQQKIYFWHGADIETQVALGKITFGSGSLTKVRSFAIESGETYYIQVVSPQSRPYDLSWDINTDAPVDFRPDDISDFDSNTGGTTSGGELIFGPNEYVQHEFLPSGHSRAADPIYIGFGIRYGDANRMLAGSGDVSLPIFELYSVSNTLINSIRLYEDLGEFQSTGNLRLSPGAVSIYKLSEDTIYVEMIVIQSQSEDLTTTSKTPVMFVQGSEVLGDLGGGSYTTQLIGYMKLGYISEPSTSPNLDLRITDVVVKTLSNGESAPDPPFYSNTADRVVVATGFTEGEIGTNTAHQGTGFRNVESITGYTIIDDPTGGGRGKVIDGSAAAESVNVPVMSTATGFGQGCISVSWWGYFTALGGPMAIVQGTEYGTTNADYIIMVCDSNGAMYIQSGFSNATRSYAHRQLATGSWHHFEIEVTKIVPRVEGRWWIDGEEQEPFFENRATGRIWARINTATISIGGSNRGYLTDVACGMKGPIGPIKSSMIVPDASGTHELGVIVNYTEGPGEALIITSTDDGITYTDLGATDPVHDLINEWPYTDSNSSDMVGEANRDSWIEYMYQAVDGDEIVKFINAFTAVRAMHIVHADFTGLHSYPDLQPHSRDQSDYGAMTSYSKFIQGGNEVNRGNGYSSGFDTNVKISQAAMGHAPDRELWTPGKIDDLVAQWGFAHFFNAGPQQGNALYAQMMEVITADSPGDTLGVWTPPEPEIFLHAQQFNIDDPPFAFTSCNGWRTTDKRTDPNMRRKVWFFPYFRTEWDETDDGPFDLYWRVSPSYDDSKPGFDGVFNHSELSPYIWTDGELYENIANYSDPDIVRWGNNFYYYQFNDAEMRVMSPSLIYDPCSLGERVYADGNVLIEAFIRDAYGVDSAIARIVINIGRGDCCPSPVHLSRVRFRIYEEDVEGPI